MLGKRARQQPMRRTTSMRELSASSEALSSAAGQVDDSRPSDLAVARQRAAEARKYGGATGDWLGSLQKAGHRTRRNSADFVPADSAPFLRACGLCKRSLGPGRDTYMYRGEVAFCSLECRQQQMNIDERVEKCVGLGAAAAQAASDQSTSGGTVAAA